MRRLAKILNGIGSFRNYWVNLQATLSKIVRNFPFGDGIGRRMAAAVGNADMHFYDARLLEYFACSPTKRDRGRTTRLVADFNISPTNSATPSRAKRFEYCFLRSPPTCVVLCCRLLSRAVGNLVGRIDTVDKQLAMALDHLRYSQALNDVCADA